jgi:hypothetical protein
MAGVRAFEARVLLVPLILQSSCTVRKQILEDSTVVKEMFLNNVNNNMAAVRKLGLASNLIAITT